MPPCERVHVSLSLRDDQPLFSSTLIPSRMASTCDSGDAIGRRPLTSFSGSCAEMGELAGKRCRCRLQWWTFQLQGQPALYLSFDLVVAAHEYAQDLTTRPGTFCQYDVSLQPVADLTSDAALTALATGVARSTIGRGLTDLDSEALPGGRVWRVAGLSTITKASSGTARSRAGQVTPDTILRPRDRGGRGKLRAAKLSPYFSRSNSIARPAVPSTWIGKPEITVPVEVELI